MPKLDAEVKELKQTIAKLLSVHHAKVEGFHATHQTKVEKLRGLHSAELEPKMLFAKPRRCVC